MLSTLDAAKFWLDAGVATVPLYPRSKVPAGQALIRSGLSVLKDGEIKGTWTPLKTRLPNEEMINLWFEDGQPYNLAVVTGWSGLVVVDFDSVDEYAAWLCWQLMHNSKITETFKVSSSRGVHLYYFLSNPTEKVISAYLPEDKRLGLSAAGYEVKYGGKLVTTAPSVHPSGKEYTILSDKILTIRSIQDVLTYSPVALHAPIVWLPRSKFAPVDTDKSSIETIKESVSLLAFFPTARKLDDHRYLADCPLHGHRANFWLDTSLGVCGCFAGCNGGKAMNVVQLFATMNNCDVKMAIRELMRMIGG